MPTHFDSDMSDTVPAFRKIQQYEFELKVKIYNLNLSYHRYITLNVFHFVFFKRCSKSESTFNTKYVMSKLFF